MSRTRIFIALTLDKSIRDRLVNLQENLASAVEGVKWVEPENLHVTLLFLGEVDDRETPAVCRVVAESCAALAAFPMSVETVGCFGNPRRPRTIWTGVGSGTEEVCALHDALEAPLLALGCYRREARKYSPHITLGRVSTDRPLESLATALRKKASWRGGEQTIHEVHVMGSELTGAGPLYTILGRGKLR